MTAPRRALIVIDVQQEYFGDILTIRHPSPEESLKRTLRAIDVAEQEDLPIAIVQHALPEGAPVFAPGTPGYALHPALEERVDSSWKRVVKEFGSVFAGTDVVDWLHENDVDTVTLVGYMTNNCVLGSAAAAEPLGFSVEVLADATGAIHLANEAGKVSAQQLHETLLVLLQSNFAAVATTEDWATTVADGTALPKSDLGTSAMRGAQAFEA